MSKKPRTLHPKTQRALAANPLFDTCPYCEQWVDTSDWGETDATDEWLLFDSDDDVWPWDEPGYPEPILRAKHTDCVEAARAFAREQGFPVKDE